MSRPTASSTGFEASKVSFGADTIIVRVPAAAPGAPPLTGASTILNPLSVTSSAASITCARPIVAVQMTVPPGLSPASSPSSVRSAALTCSTFRTIIKTVSAAAPTSRGDVAVYAPSCASVSNGSGRTSYTVSSCPAFRMFLDIPIPMLPTPINPTFAINYLKEFLNNSM